MVKDLVGGLGDLFSMDPREEIRIKFEKKKKMQVKKKKSMLYVVCEICPGSGKSKTLESDICSRLGRVS